MIGDAVIHPSQQARNLGVVMDPALNMCVHVNNVCKRPDTSVFNAEIHRKTGARICYIKIGFL